MLIISVRAWQFNYALKTSTLRRMSFFEIIGIVVCVFVVLLVLGVLFLVWKLKRAFSDIKEGLADLQMPMALPARIHPIRREKLTWGDEEAVNKLLQPLWRLGF